MLKGRITTRIAGERHVQIGEVNVPEEVQMELRGSGGDPDAEVQFRIRNDRPECVRFSVTAKPDGRGLRTTDLTGFNLNGLAEGAFLDWATGPEGGPLGGSDDRESWALRARLGRAINAPGRGPSEAELKRVALIYRTNPEAPTSAVQTEMRLSRRTASRRVQQAREAGLL